MKSINIVKLTKWFKALTLFLIAASCSSEKNQNIDLSKYFTRNNVDGCFILYDLNNDNYKRYNADLCEKEFLPASTFKIPHALIALETGIIPDTNYILKWDGKTRSVQAWNNDHNLKSAIQNSVVWFFSEIAGRIGEERMQKWIDSLHYGNQNISGVFPFWLSGNMRITPNQQIEFLKDFYLGNLPFSIKYIELVKEIILLEKNESYTLRAKTGWADAKGINTGWFVGYVENADGVFLFANLITSREINKNFVKLRNNITKDILTELGLI